MINILLLAPTDVSGGIATWAKVFTSHVTAGRVKVINTASTKLTLGETGLIRRGWFGSTSTVRRIAQLLQNCLSRPRPDLVYLTCSPSAGLWLRDFPMILLIKALKIPAIVHLHGGSEAGFFGAGRLARAAATFIYRRAASVIVITREMESRARSQLGSHPVYYIPNMLEPAQTAATSKLERRPSEATRRITALHVGWQGIAKGTLDILDVASRVRELNYVLVGPIPTQLAPALDHRMSSLDLDGFVRFAGELRGEALLAEYANADIFLFPSHGEGFPMAIMEALEHSLPVIATDVGAIPDILASDTADSCGIVVRHGPPVDQVAIQSALRTLACNAGLRRQLGENGRKRVLTQYAPEAVMPTLTAVLLSAAGHKRYGRARHRLASRLRHSISDRS